MMRSTSFLLYLPSYIGVVNIVVVMLGIMVVVVWRQNVVNYNGSIVPTYLLTIN